MKIDINKLASIFLLIFSVLQLSLVLNETSSFFSYVTLFLLLTFPGLLILMILRVRKLNFWVFVTFIVGLSLSFILLTGLLFNWLWYYFLHSPPLTKFLLTVLYSILFIILGILAYWKNNRATLHVELYPKFNLKLLFFLTPTLALVFSIMGAITLNNNGPNYLSLLSLISIAVFSSVLLAFHNKIDKNIYPYSIFCISLSLLLMLSLRSWFLSGWDIQDENRVFQLTRDSGLWSPVNIKHDYNACLSITLFPSILNILTNIHVEIIFKFIYQILFSLVPLAVYLIASRYALPIMSYFAAFYLIMQPFFIQPMVALMRQEIAFVFFALLLLSLFESKISNNTRNFFVLLFGTSLIVSHYSTTYAALFLLLFTYLFIIIFRGVRKIGFVRSLATKAKVKSHELKKHSYFISPIVLILLFVFAIIWYSVINSTASHASQVANEVLKDMNNMFKSESENDEAKKAIEIVPNKQANPLDDVNQYIQNQQAIFKSDLNQRYDPSTYRDLVSLPVSPELVSPIFVSSFNQHIFLFSQLLKQLLKIFVLLGAIIVLFTKFKNSKFDREFIVLGIVSAAFITLMLVHPTLANHYNLSRFYLQSLIILTLPAVVGGMFFFSFLRKYSIYATGFSFIVMYLFFSGVASQVIGGEATLHLNNKGGDYDKFYTHASEIKSGEWFEKNRDKNVAVFADSNANLRLRYASWTPTINVILPQIIYKKSYVYANETNIVQHYTYGYDSGKSITYTFPEAFLMQNKDVVYSNGKSVIFR